MRLFHSVGGGEPKTTKKNDAAETEERGKREKGRKRTWRRWKIVGTRTSRGKISNSSLYRDIGGGWKEAEKQRRKSEREDAGVKREITKVGAELQLTCQILNKIPAAVDFRAIDNSVVTRAEGQPRSASARRHFCLSRAWFRLYGSFTSVGKLISTPPMPRVENKRPYFLRTYSFTSFFTSTSFLASFSRCPSPPTFFLQHPFPRSMLSLLPSCTFRSRRGDRSKR